MINVTVIGDRELIAKLAAMPARVRAELVKTITALGLKLQAHIVQDKLQGQVLNHRTGALQRSIHSTVDQSGSSVIGKTASSGDVKYAAIHEFGGRTKAHIIEAKNGKALAFMMGGKQRFFARVNHPGSQMPERSFMRSSLKDMQDEITREITAAVVRGAQNE